MGALNLFQRHSKIFTRLKVGLDNRTRLTYQSTFLDVRILSTSQRHRTLRLFSLNKLTVYLKIQIDLQHSRMQIRVTGGSKRSLLPSCMESQSKIKLSQVSQNREAIFRQLVSRSTQDKRSMQILVRKKNQSILWRTCSRW